MSKVIKWQCPECKHIEPKKWKDHIIDIIQAFFITGGFFFWLILILIVAKPQLTGQLIDYTVSFIWNNIVGYEIDDYMRGVAIEQVKDCNGGDHCAITSLLNFTHNNLTYVADPTGELFRTPQEILEDGFGDCSSFAALYVGLARQVGLPSRIVSEIHYSDGWRVGHLVVITETLYGDVYKVDPTRGTYEVIE